MDAARTLGGAALAVMLLAGCTGSGDDADATTSGAASTASPSSTAGTTADGAKASGIDPANPPKPLGSVTVPTPAEGVESTLVELLELRRRDTVLVATFRVTPKPASSGTGDVTLAQAVGGAFAPQLLDLGNLKRYRYVEALRSDQRAVESVDGSPMYAFAAYAIPQGTSTVDVRVSDIAPLVEKVSFS